MDITAGPATLGGLILCVAICGWALGRWQAVGLSEYGGDNASPQSVHGTIAAGLRQDRMNGSAPLRCPQPMAVAFPDLPQGDFSLGELHREVTAFRDRERILATLSVDAAAGGSRLFERTQPSSSHVNHAACPLTDALGTACDSDDREKLHRQAPQPTTVPMARLPQPASELSA